jgi:hypothetical protein
MSESFQIGRGTRLAIWHILCPTADGENKTKWQAGSRLIGYMLDVGSEECHLHS